jgi:PST family polysaccharide transporter
MIAETRSAGIPGDGLPDLRGRSIRGGAVTLGAQAASQGISLVSIAVLARLLAPEEYGSVTMVVALTGFLNLFRELGLSGATIQRRTLSQEEVSSLFFINVCVGLVVMLATIASAPLIAWFYSRPDLAGVAVGLSLGPFVNSLGTQHAALLNRGMRFRALAAIQLSSLVAGFAAALVVALWGGGYWALVASNVSTAVWGTVGFWLLSGFRPSWPRRQTDVRPMLRFGAAIVGFDLAYYFRGNVDKILIGSVWGGQPLGLYEKAFSLLLLPISSLRFPLNKVAFPAMSALAPDPLRFRSYFARYCSLLAFASMPLVAFLYASSDRIIRLLLGSRWAGAAGLFRILAVAGFIEAVATLRTTVIVSSGHGRRLVVWAAINAGATVLAVSLGAAWGATGVAVAYTVTTYVVFHPLLVYALRGTSVRPGDFYRSVARPAAASLGMLASYQLLVEPLLRGPDVVVLAAAVPACALAFLALYAGLPGGRATLREYWSYVRIILPPWSGSRGETGHVAKGNAGSL